MAKAKDSHKKTKVELSEEARLFRLSINGESDRGCALMVGSILDASLGRMLRQHFVDDGKLMEVLFEGTGPLSTFSSRIALSFGLGLVSSAVMKDLNLIRKIRNDFGHDPTLINFETPSISQRCNELNAHAHTRSVSHRAVFTTSAINILAIIHGAYLRAKRPLEANEIFTAEWKTRSRKSLVKQLDRIAELPEELSAPILAGLVPYDEVKKMLERHERK